MMHMFLFYNVWMMQGERQPNVQKFVDKYFLPHFYLHLQQQHNSATCTAQAASCSLCARIKAAQGERESYRRQLLLNQDDIDLLELMDPKSTPEAYMRSILRLYCREENLRPRELSNQPMQLTLTTRRLLNSQPRFPQCLPVPGLSHEEGPDDQEQTRQETLDRAQICRLRDECYLGLGKMIVERKETQGRRGLGKSNYHTRQYLLPQVKEEVERRTAEGAIIGEHKFYLLASANSRGISFPADHMPPLLSHVLQFDSFREIVCTLNGIIQQTVYQHRTQASRNKKINTIYGWQWVWMLALVSLLIVNSLVVGSQAVTGICLVAVLCLVMFILMVSCHRFREQIIYVSLVDLLNVKITDYLNYLNSRPDSKLYWKTQERLYWIQITVNDDIH